MKARFIYLCLFLFAAYFIVGCYNRNYGKNRCDMTTEASIGDANFSEVVTIPTMKPAKETQGGDQVEFREDIQAVTDYRPNAQDYTEVLIEYPPRGKTGDIQDLKSTGGKPIPILNGDYKPIIRESQTDTKERSKPNHNPISQDLETGVKNKIRKKWVCNS